MNNPYPKKYLKCLELLKVLVEFINAKEVKYTLEHSWDPGDIGFGDLLISFFHCAVMPLFFSTLGIFQNQRSCAMVEQETQCLA